MTHKLLWDVDIQTDHLISAKRPDLIIIKKKRTCKIVDFAVPADHRVKLKENEEKNKYLDLARELKKTVEHENSVYSYYNWCSWQSHQRINKRTLGIGNKRISKDYSNYCIIEIGQSIKKRLGDLRRFAVPQTPMKDHQQALMEKTLK